jgi:hypothetical protein
MMKELKSIYLIVILLFIHMSCNSGNPGCTDPQALNYNPAATEDDNSCVYEIANLSPQWSIELSTPISESSGLLFWDGGLWTMNDDTDPRLYKLDTVTGEASDYIYLWRVVNRNWEEIAQDEDYIYLGDFGNNSGSRKDLHILRIDKLSLESGRPPSIDSISFSYSDQLSFSNPGLNQTDYDCEAFVVSSDSIYLFTKQWLSAGTAMYSLPKLPGTYVAQKREVFDTQGQVTGATYLEQEKLLVLLGAVSGLGQPFLYLLYDYQGQEFFSGVQKRVNLAIPFHQTEGIATKDGIHYYVSNERFEMESYINIPQKLHKFYLGEFLGDYLKGN